MSGIKWYRFGKKNKSKQSVLEQYTISVCYSRNLAYCDLLKCVNTFLKAALEKCLTKSLKIFLL